MLIQLVTCPAWLFGSVAGQAVSVSDANLLLVLKERDVSFLEQGFSYRQSSLACFKLFASFQKELEEMAVTEYLFLE